MKRIFNCYMRSFLTLVGVIVLFSCSTSENNEIVDNPNYNPETGEVNTKFVFSVSTGSESTTRQSSTTVQAGSSDGFRGMEAVKVMAFKQTTDGKHIYAPTVADKVYDLSTILTPGQINETNQNRVIELSLPLNTNTLTFYGKAIKDGTEEEQGSISIQINGDPANTYFKLKSRLEDVEMLTQTQTLLEKLLSRVVDCGLHQETYGVEARDFRYAFAWPGSTGQGEELTGAERTAALATLTTANGQNSYKDGSNTIYVGTLEWKDLGANYANEVPMSPLEEILGSTYCSFTNINTDEVRAGSAMAVLRAVNDVMITNDKVANAVPTGPEEYRAKLLAIRLATRFENYFEADATGGTKFKSISAIKESFRQYLNEDPSHYSRVTDNELLNFPKSLNLPMGAAQLNFVDGEFTYKKSNIILGMDNSTTELTNLMWPAELCYFGNSPVRVTAETVDKTSYPATVVDWRDDNNAKWADFVKDSHVSPLTRGVAMQNDINYGTALLKSTIHVTSDKLVDNKHKFHGVEENIVFDASNSTLFSLTGILVGGQNNEMGWNFLRKYDADETSADGVNHSSSFNYVIFDNTLGKDASTGEYNGIPVLGGGAISAPNYTLVFDNYNSLLGPDEQSPVFVALEFVNNTGSDFYGENGLVRNGGYFYIVGKLDPNTATNKDTITFPDGTGNSHPLPPYDENGKTIPAKRVFIQDYMTTVEFQINETSLQHAFVTVPDLRATNISLGMAVNLKWTPGLDFKVIVGQ